MKMNRKTVFAIWILGVLFLSLGMVPAFQGKYVKANGGQILTMSIDSSRFPDIVLAHVSVDMPYTLTKTAFEIYEDGKKQQITSFEYTGGRNFIAPVDLVFIIDRSGSMGDDIDDIKNNAYKLAEDLKSSGIDARFALITFGLNPDDARIDLHFTDDVSELKQALDSIVINGGIEWSFDGIMEAFKLNFRPTAQKVFIVVTDEDDQSQSKYSVEEVANKVKSEGVFLVLVYNHNNGYRLSQLSQAVGALDMDILEARQKGFGEVLQRITTTIGQQYHIGYSPTNKNMDGSEREVKVVIHLPDGSTLEATSSYVAPTEKREKYEPKSPGQELLEVLNGVSQWIMDSESRIYRSTLHSSWELNLERPYIPKAPGEFSVDFLKFVVDVNKLEIPPVSHDDLRLLFKFLEKNKEYPLNVGDFRINKVSRGIYRISKNDFEFYIVTAKVSKVQKQTINLFGISRDAYLNLYMQAMIVQKDISFENVRLKLFLNYLEAIGQVDGNKILHKDVLLPYVNIESLGSSKILKPRVKVPLLDSELYGSVGGGGRVVAKILGKGLEVDALLELIQLQATLQDILEKEINSISLGSTASLKIEVGDIEFKRTLGISTELGSGISLGDYTKLFMGYLGYNILPSTKIGIPFVWEGDLKDGAYVFMVKTIEDLRYESRKRTYLSKSEEYSVTALSTKHSTALPISYYVPTIKKALVDLAEVPVLKTSAMTIYELKPIEKYIIQLKKRETTLSSELTLDMGFNFKRSSKTNLLPVSSPDYRYQEEVGFYLDIGKEFKIDIPAISQGIKLELNVLHRKIKIAEIGIFATVFGKSGFETPIFAIELIDPPLGGSIEPKMKVIFVNETSIDKNADGKFEEMQLVFNITTDISGRYYIYPLIYSESTNTIIPVKKIETNLERNSPTYVRIAIPSQYIYYTNHTGPFDVGLIIQDENGTLVYYNFSLGKTKSYDYRQFEHVVPEFDFKYTPVDKDGDGKYDEVQINVTEVHGWKGFTVTPLLTGNGWIIYLNTTNITSPNYTITVDGMHVRKLMGNFTFLMHVANMTSRVYLGSYQWKVSENPAKFESEYPTIEDVAPITFNYKPAVRFTVNVPIESNMTISVKYRVGSSTHVASGYFEDVTPGVHNLTVLLDESVFTLYGQSTAKIVSAELKANGLTTDSIMINKDASFFILPRGRIWNLSTTTNVTLKTVNVTAEILSYQDTNATVIVTFTSGNVTMAEFLYPELRRQVILRIPVDFDLSGVLSNLSREASVSVIVYTQDGILVDVKTVTLDITSLLPKSHASTSKESGANIILLSHVWTTWFFKYYDEFEELYANATTLGVKNETLTKALELHENATKLLKKAWRTEDLDSIRGKLWSQMNIVPNIAYVRKAYLLEKEALETLKKAIKEKNA